MIQYSHVPATVIFIFTMDLTQCKLSRAEWEGIDVPTSSEEMRIIRLIIAGYHDVDICRNPTMTILQHLKIKSSNEIDSYIFTQYLQKPISKIAEKYSSVIVGGEDSLLHMSSISSAALKKADLIRFANTEKKINEHKDSMFEFILLDLLTKMYKYKYKYDKKEQTSSSPIACEKNWLFYYYTLLILLTYRVEHINTRLFEVLTNCVRTMTTVVNIPDMITASVDVIERNNYLNKYADETLYDHQKSLFTICKRSGPKLVLYIAPTGTGKTISPLGLSENHRIIFVCAARHVGLALAKAAVSAEKKIAFAFGCNGAEDIRLHYAAAEDFTRSKRSGRIGKVDNSLGSKVEIIISDIKSYLFAMNYMLGFNPKENIILYWDEPSITMDYDVHEFHPIIKKNWRENVIPNIVLSSATLPRSDELTDTIRDFRATFGGEEAEIHEIVSYDCKKTIPIINNEGFVEMPHYLHTEYEDTLKVVGHCQKYSTLLRYIDLGEAVRFIMYIHNHDKISGTDMPYISSDGHSIGSRFLTPSTITMASIKIYYLELLGNLKPDAWSSIYRELLSTRVKRQESNINIVSSDAHTLTDGPTIFLTDDVNKVAQFCIQSAKIPGHVSANIMAAIEHNSNLTEQIAKRERDFADGAGDDAGGGNPDDLQKLAPDMKRLLQNIEGLKSMLKKVQLNPSYVPNTKEHLDKYTAQKVFRDTPFTCRISEQMVEKIMMIDHVDDIWKLLLLMGIGVFSGETIRGATIENDKGITNPRYTEIMKTLAQEQRLYLIIASSDYIYGTNYQFCHGYIGKDMATKMSQEKCIQAMGRVGRNKLQHDYTVRFRDNELIMNLFHDDTNKPECLNMQKLFTRG